MKKLMMMAMMLVASATAFAGDSDALKAILKAKDFKEAQSLISSSLAQLTDASEKAKAYNKLVDLAYEKYKKEDDVKTTNMVMHKEDPVDTDGMLEAGKVALQAAMECDKYDQQPNEKGKVAIKFRQKNQDRTKVIRLSLLQAGIDLANNEKNKEAFDNFDVYLQSAKSAFFEGVDGVSKNDPNLGVAAFYGGRAAYNLEKFDKAIEYFKIGVADTAKQIHDLSFDFLLYTMRNSQKTAADSAKFLTDMADLYKEYPDAEQIYSSLSDAYIAKGMNAEVIKLADERMAKYPDSSLPHVYKAFLLMQDKKYDDAIAEFAKVKEDKSPVYLNSIFNSAVCKYNKASEFNEANSDIRTGRLKPADHDKFMNMLKDAQGDFEKAKELDPDQKTVKWQYLLHNVYTLTGQEDKAKALE
jgi:predicted Zn-dependent protease